MAKKGFQNSYNNMQYKIHFETLGCKLNQIESESIAKSFIDDGFDCTMEAITAKQDSCCDTILCIINTCTVTSKAEQKARRIIRLLLEKFPKSVVVVTGCYAEVEADSIEKIDSRIAVLKGTAKDALADYPNIIKKYLEENPLYGAKDFADFLKLHFSKVSLNHSTFRLSTDSFIHHSRASIKIQDGCGNNCAYCRIHIARGKPVSLEAEEVILRVKQLEEANQKEVVLTGVNLSQYRSKYTEDNVEKIIDFADLLKILLEKTTNINFRISSLYPDRVDSELAPILRNPRVCPHFHLSVQSGSNNILKSMNRAYNRDVIIDAVKRLREAKPNCFIACDIIAGFPGETEEDFNQSLELCKECDFTWVHAFPFSPRPGTVAYSMKNKIPEQVSKNRVKMLTDFGKESKNRYISNLISKEIPAIVEKRRFPEIRVVTNNFIHVKITNTKDFSDVDLGGKKVTIKITEICNNSSQTEAPEAYGIITKI